ncbi:DoxX family protein [Actinomyces sp. 2119]|uniref:DoxX family membrane protein n=1 Tax=Actinomyces sp. 2119 TaxID=2321393 RepID=UPI000E6C1431|nr:DoxX family membrane protein [Actinomyces sp. 2119]RJF43255.1 DoxX family protein [Actinomyces sp. 2119]
MNLLRALVRPMLAAPFIADGIDAVTRPQRHVEKFEKVAPTLERAGLPPLLTSDTRLLTRLSGAASLLAGLGLASGRAPRTSAAVLAVVNTPLTLVNYPVWTAHDPAERRDSVSGLLRGAAVGAGLVLATVDRQGKPSLAWRLRSAHHRSKAARAATQTS